MTTFAVALILTSCGKEPDYTPVGDGLKAIAICLVVYGVIAALAELAKEERSELKPPEQKERRKRKPKNGPGGES